MKNDAHTQNVKTVKTSKKAIDKERRRRREGRNRNNIQLASYNSVYSRISNVFVV